MSIGSQKRVIALGLNCAVGLVSSFQQHLHRARMMNWSTVKWVYKFKLKSISYSAWPIILVNNELRTMVQLYIRELPGDCFGKPQTNLYHSLMENSLVVDYQSTITGLVTILHQSLCTGSTYFISAPREVHCSIIDAKVLSVTEIHYTCLIPVLFNVLLVCCTTTWKFDGKIGTWP